MTPSDVTHPTARVLERVVLGEGDASALAHVEGCAECAAWVASEKRAAADFAADPARSPERFLAAVAARASRESEAKGGGAGASEPPRASVVPLARVVRARLYWAAAPLAAAALILLFFRPSAAPPREVGEGVPPVATDIAFKGAMAIAVIRERTGTQERITSDVEIRPLDRIRLELSLDTPRPIAAGVLADDGTWATLIAPAVLDGGTHFSELSVRFDESPKSGVVVVGDPAAIERARATRELTGLRVLRLHAQ